MKKYSVLLPLLLCLAVASCTPKAVSGRQPISLVMDITYGVYPSYSDILARHQSVNKDGEIFIAGPAQSCSLLCRNFLECDEVDNARGSSRKDGLKDFAGESFSCISDSQFIPYTKYYTRNATDSLRELAVRYALAALDDRCNISVYDLDGNGGKAPAKIIVFPDPWLCRYGLFDVDTLFTISSCKVPVISSQDLLLSSVFQGPRKAFNIGLIVDSSYVGTGIYPEIFRAKTTQYNVVGAQMFEGAGGSGRGALYSFLDSYAMSGRREALDAILVDDLKTDIDSLKSQLAAIRDFSREESMTYGRLVSDNLVIYSSSELTMQKCYSILRTRGLFTHKISQPVSRTYSVNPRPWAEDMQFLLIPSSNVQN